ncbi:MAG: hypothetical protein IT532_14190 [Burkholderiales bacterium]|nr:hypothetical protein [Burkholderiales bacterium]
MNPNATLIEFERDLAEQGITRTGGAPLVSGNCVRILRDSTENYPAWLEAIAEARRYVLFENYIIGKDEVGRQFVEALAKKAREGVRVRLIYDWLGSPFSGRLFRPLEEAGGEVRCFNPPRFYSPFGLLTRDHRKTVSVDGEVAFVSGLCIARRWAGSAQRGIEPWRDTGVEIRGPSVPEIERAFLRVWKAIGPDDAGLPLADASPTAGNVSVMVVASEPNRGGLYRLDHFIATVARHTLWLTDAYYVGTPPYVEALRAAAHDGVDVRLLVPGSSDLPVTQAFTRAGYRPLLEAGVRVFEWNGSMLHAKTSVADGRWARVGSSNLNVSSWLANYELDLAVYDNDFGRQMQEMYVRDLTMSTEIVLSHRKIRPREQRRVNLQPLRGSASRAAASALRIGNTVGAALTNRRVLTGSEAVTMAKFGAGFLVVAVLGVFFPRALAIPVALLLSWLGATLVLRAWRIRRRVQQEAAAQAEGQNRHRTSADP